MKLASVAWVLCFWSVAAISAGPFDGVYAGLGTSTNQCLDRAELRFAIKDGKFQDFSLVGPRGSANTVQGGVADDGTGIFTYGRTASKGTLVFKGDSFTGTIETLCGPRQFGGQQVK